MGAQPICEQTIFVDPDFKLPPTTTVGALAGLTFAVKDLFALKGRAIGAGNPEWADAQKPCTRNAEIVDCLLGEGAALKGVTILDEFAFSLIGENSHYGVPPNPAAPEHYCGGSSCGSAAAVANGIVDFSLGTDTAGSIRIPASNCGLYGLRIGGGGRTAKGIAHLSPSFDAIGWFAPSWRILDCVTKVLTREKGNKAEALAIDVNALADMPQHLAERVEDAAKAVAAQEKLTVVEWTSDRALHAALSDLFIEVELYEAWRIYGAWVSAEERNIADDVRDRFRLGSLVSDQHYQKNKTEISRICREIENSLAGAMLARPTAPLGPLPLTASKEDKAHYRRRTIEHTALVSALGWSELSAPLFTSPDESPCGVSLCIEPSGERSMLAAARHVKSRSDQRK